MVTSLALLAVTACGEAPDATAPPAPSASTSVAADIARQNAETDRSLHLLVRLELSADELFEIYEPAPGQIVLSGAGAPTHPVLLPEDVDNQTIEQIWRRVAGARPMPQSLVAALALMNGRPGPKPPPKLDASSTVAPVGTSELMVGPPGPRPPPKLAASNTSASVDNSELMVGPPGPRPPPKLAPSNTSASVGISELMVGPPGPRPPPKLAPSSTVASTADSVFHNGRPGPRPPPKLDAQASHTVPGAGWCNVDYYDLGYGHCAGASADCVDDGENARQASANAEGSYANVCAVEGDGMLEVKSGERYAGIWNVPENTVRWYQSLQRNAEVGEILNASGERFHFRVLVENSGR
jgi:hypothetical protein